MDEPIWTNVELDRKPALKASVSPRHEIFVFKLEDSHGCYKIRLNGKDKPTLFNKNPALRSCEDSIVGSKEDAIFIVHTIWSDLTSLDFESSFHKYELIYRQALYAWEKWCGHRAKSRISKIAAGDYSVY